MAIAETPSVVRDATGHLIASYDPKARRLTVRSSTGDEIFSDNRTCLALAFLPPPFPSTLIVVNDSRQVYLLNVTDPSQFGSGNLGVPDFDALLRVSIYPPNVVFAFVSNAVIHVYELLSPMRCLPIRRC
jgi:hypothetical protein